ncbi:MAG TPA: discoidin domain-containing protein [Terracidiphilus sp.]|nr:discoidin domain-containing protein [Terracidiphilus sp.]
MKHLALVLFAFSLVSHAQQSTRGIGVYPGEPSQYSGPALVSGGSGYRNLALHRPAYQSSAYDYNLTAQLVTDGIVETALPYWVVTSTSDGGTLQKREREFFLDGNPTSSIDVSGEHPWVQFAIKGSDTPPTIDRVDLWLRRIYVPHLSGRWTYTILGSDDMAHWTEVGRATGTEWPSMKISGPSFQQTIPLNAPAHFRAYRLELSAAAVHTWGVALLALFHHGQEVHVAGPRHFHSAWMSAGSGEEWVYVDLGARSTFDRIVLDWIRPAAAGLIQVSGDAEEWQTLAPLPSASALHSEIRLAHAAHGRYVRVLMTKASAPDDRYILSELEVFGRGGLIAQPKPAAVAEADGSLPLAGGAWRVQRASLVAAGGDALSTPGYHDKDWMIATVPGTVLTSYLNDGAVPNPDFGDNQYAISDSFFCGDFWYRDEFLAPAANPTQPRFWLNFDGINWKAEIYLNGHDVGRMDGGFTRGRFDVTPYIHPGAVNALAVRIVANAHPGSTKDKAGPSLNGGALGRDNPTYHASIGWDWISTIRGRDTGIWSNVSLTTSGEVTVRNPLVTTTLPLPDTTHADIDIAATLTNLTAAPVSGTLQARFGSITVEEPVTLAASASRTVELTPASQPALHLTNPKLWWPVGYGAPNLYPVTITFLVNGKASDSTSFETGIRQFTYSEDGGVLKMWINGRRFIARGGNWGFPESMLRYRAREYETALRYHRDEHFDMIRDWVGQTADEAFYDAADRNGVVIWQDFWLANPWDGPNPDDNALFLANAKDYLLRIRNHPSLGLFCGRNEGFPPAPIDEGLRRFVASLVPGSHYISSSADGPVSGHGPYRAEPLPYYFEHAPTKFHSEMGSPNIPEMDTLRRTMPVSALWPQGSQWPLHDFNPRNSFATAIDKQFGGADNLSQWDSLAQFVDYNAYRGMFEGQNENRLGLLIWMSHPAWPSLLWQTYDYFFATDAGYFGAKKGAEPLHIQWNAATDAVEVVNDSAGEQAGLTARAEVLNIDGSLKWQKSAALDSREDSTVSPYKLEFPAGLSRTYFIRLTLLREGRIVSRNFYLHGLAQGDYEGIRNLPAAKVKVRTHIHRSGETWFLTAELHNVSHTPALMVRVKAVRRKSGDPILPALYSDNYIALMPGERRTLEVQLLNEDTRGERPRIVLEGYNLETRKRD